VTDGSFEGLLTAIFEAYSEKGHPHSIEPDSDGQTPLFDRRTRILTDTRKSDRVWAGLKKPLGPAQRQRLFEAYLSGSPGVETMIYRLVREALPSRNDPGFRADLSCRIEVQKLSGKVRREAHRMKGFCRFQNTGGDRYLAVIAPRYDVLPLIRRHFESRFADQQWIIYDAKRHYGICYDRKTSRGVTLDTDQLAAAQRNDIPAEKLCQTLWRRYYEAATIPQRGNPKQHLGKLPRRYWRYLTEKSGESSGKVDLSFPASATPRRDGPK
jgi:probable DNA metabolism protein